MRSILAAALSMAAIATPLAAQQPAEYRAQADTAWYRLHNPFRLYWVRSDGDTIGWPAANTSVERHVWLPGPDLRVEVTQQSLGLSREMEVDTITLLQDGRVVPTPDTTDVERIDFVLPLPASAIPLTVGAEWTDTLIQDQTYPSGPSRYHVYRHLRVERMLDSLGTRLADVRSTGLIEFGGSWWVDSIAGTRRWMDATGETTETFLFDVARGRFVARSWSMHLRGTGALPDEAGEMDTVPAGLISGETLALIDAAEADAHTRELPPGDTFYTVRPGEAALSLHTGARDDRSIRSGFARADGMTGTAEATYAAAEPTSFAVTWTSFGEEPRRWSATVRGDSIEVDGAPSIPLPQWGDRWAIADYGMDELLLPALTSLPADGTPYVVAVYRPFPDRWDEAEAIVVRRAGAVVAVVEYADLEGTWYFILNEDGEPLLIEHDSPPDVTQRLPAMGSRLRDQMEQTLQRLLAPAQPRT